MLPLSISAYHGLPYRVVSYGSINYYVHLGCGLDNVDADKLEQLFNNAWRRDHSRNVVIKGGRGQTVLFDLPLSVLSSSPSTNSTDPAPAACDSTLDPSCSTTNAASPSKELLGSDSALAYEHIADALWPAPDATVSWCYRQYLRGGLVGKIISSHFFRYAKLAHRAQDEFLMLLKMRMLGLPVPRPIVAKETQGVITLSNEIIIEQIPNTQNLFEILNHREMSKDEAFKLGKMLANFFQYNVYHSDLNLRNVLLNDAGEFFLIDFDKCYFESNQFKSALLITKMLDRLQRSFNKALTLNPGFKYQESWMHSVRDSTLQHLISLSELTKPLENEPTSQVPMVTPVLAQQLISCNWSVQEAQANFAAHPELRAKLVEKEHKWLAAEQSDTAPKINGATPLDSDKASKPYPTLRAPNNQAPTAASFTTRSSSLASPLKPNQLNLVEDLALESALQQTPESDETLKPNAPNTTK